MRWALIVAVGSILLASVPASAGTFVIKVSKPNGSWSAYLDDQGDCSRAAGYRNTSWMSGNWLGPIHYSEADRAAQLDRYWACMAAKGYRGDPNGFKAETISYSKTPPRYTP
ncbi:hypothetical protein FHS83_003230 [Rhizomicrobium palustre]|uniref:Secreted protein n=1 Tax=Rhizomicrobium palustre TaxID=189966 RepID=A0A846N3X3_9PROT|nr:hypothetical protein [Rhizomicrobium palustre]NIK89912.1 hypothetical protein [Rhizomicrobium palustre]